MWSAGEGASTQMASLSSSAQGCCSSSSACLSLQVGHDHVPLLRLCFANTHRNCEALVLWAGLCELVHCDSQLHRFTVSSLSILSACPCRHLPTAEGRQPVWPVLEL